MPQRIRVLLADGDTIWRESLVRELASQPDIELVGIADCESEVAVAVTRTRPHFVVLDPDLPDFATLKTLQNISSRQRPKTIVCTGISDEAAVMKARELGAVDYLLKPCSPSAVIGRVRLHAYAEAKKTRRAGPADNREPEGKVPDDRLMFLARRYAASELVAALSIQLGREGLRSLAMQEGRLDWTNGPSAAHHGFGNRLLSLAIGTLWFALLPSVCRVVPLNPMITMLLWFGVFVVAGKRLDSVRIAEAAR